jgi:hypothetical protein
MQAIAGVVVGATGLLFGKIRKNKIGFEELCQTLFDKACKNEDVKSLPSFKLYDLDEKAIESKWKYILISFKPIYVYINDKDVGYNLLHHLWMMKTREDAIHIVDQLLAFAGENCFEECKHKNLKAEFLFHLKARINMSL